MEKNNKHPTMKKPMSMVTARTTTSNQNPASMTPPNNHHGMSNSNNNPYAGRRVVDNPYQKQSQQQPNGNGMSSYSMPNPYANRNPVKNPYEKNEKKSPPQITIRPSPTAVITNDQSTFAPSSIAIAASEDRPLPLATATAAAAAAASIPAAESLPSNGGRSGSSFRLHPKGDTKATNQANVVYHTRKKNIKVDAYRPYHAQPFEGTNDELVRLHRITQPTAAEMKDMFHNVPTFTRNANSRKPRVSFDVMSQRSSLFSTNTSAPPPAPSPSINSQLVPTENHLTVQGVLAKLNVQYKSGNNPTCTHPGCNAIATTLRIPEESLGPGMHDNTHCVKHAVPRELFVKNAAGCGCGLPRWQQCTDCVNCRTKGPCRKCNADEKVDPSRGLCAGCMNEYQRGWLEERREVKRCIRCKQPLEDNRGGTYTTKDICRREESCGKWCAYKDDQGIFCSAPRLGTYSGRTTPYCEPHRREMSNKARKECRQRKASGEESTRKMWKETEVDALVGLMRSEEAKRVAKGGKYLNRKKIVAEFLRNNGGWTEQQVVRKFEDIQGGKSKYGEDWKKDGDEKKKGDKK